MFNKFELLHIELRDSRFLSQFLRIEKSIDAITYVIYVLFVSFYNICI